VDLERQPGSNAIAPLALERTIAIEDIVRDFWSRAIDRLGGRAGAENQAYISYRRPATMLGVPSPYPEATRDAEDVDRMWDVLT
jgi:hypothetical protein